MSGLEIPLAIAGVAPTAVRAVKSLMSADAEHFVNIAIQVERDVEYAKTQFGQLGELLQRNQELKRWLNVTISNTEMALADFKKHLPMPQEDKGKASITRKTDYVLHRDGVVDLDKTLQYSHSALLTGIGLMCQVPLHRSMAMADQVTEPTRASSMPPSDSAPQPREMAGRAELA